MDGYKRSTDVTGTAAASRWSPPPPSAASPRKERPSNKQPQRPARHGCCGSPSGGLGAVLTREVWWSELDKEWGDVGSGRSRNGPTRANAARGVDQTESGLWRRGRAVAERQPTTETKSLGHVGRHGFCLRLRTCICFLSGLG